MVCDVTTCLRVTELRRQCTSYMAPTQLWNKFLLLNWDGFKWILKKSSLICIKSRHTHPQLYETDCKQWKFGTPSYYRSTFQGTTTPAYGKMNLSEPHFASELKWAAVYLANWWLSAEFSINYWKQSLKIQKRLISSFLISLSATGWCSTSDGT